VSRRYYWGREERTAQLAMMNSHDGKPIDLEDEYTCAVVELSEEIDRLDDLRRWRPLTADHAGLKSNDVALLRKLGSRMTQNVTIFAGGWMKCEGAVGISPSEYHLYEWAYIPGEGPEEKR
jgi:hypothetical protein